VFHVPSESLAHSAFQILACNDDTANYTLVIQKDNIFLATVFKAVTSLSEMVPSQRAAGIPAPLSL